MLPENSRPRAQEVKPPPLEQQPLSMPFTDVDRFAHSQFLPSLEHPGETLAVVPSGG
jgi:hypothetical protein